MIKELGYVKVHFDDVGSFGLSNETSDQFPEDPVRDATSGAHGESC
jgi:hypothetical protein